MIIQACCLQPPANTLPEQPDLGFCQQATSVFSEIANEIFRIFLICEKRAREQIV